MKKYKVPFAGSTRRAPATPAGLAGGRQPAPEGTGRGRSAEATGDPLRGRSGVAEAVRTAARAAASSERLSYRDGVLWSGLRPEERRAFLLDALAGGDDYRDLADAMGVSPESMRQRLADAMATLGFSPLGEGHPPPGPGIPIELTSSSTCRWPLWSYNAKPDEPRLYCGAPKDPASKSAYCTSCAKRAYTAARPRGHASFAVSLPRLTVDAGGKVRRATI